MKPEIKERLIQEEKEFYAKFGSGKLQAALDRIQRIDSLSNAFEANLDNPVELEKIFNSMELSGIQVFEVLGTEKPRYWGGSHQYNAIGYVVYTSEFFKEHGWSFGQWTEFLGLKVHWDGVDHTYAFQDIKEIVLTHYDDLDERLDTEELVRQLEQKIINKELTSIEAAYQMAQERDWDLWSTEFHLCTLKCWDVDKQSNPPAWGYIWDRIDEFFNSEEIGLGIAAMISVDALTLEATNKWGFGT